MMRNPMLSSIKTEISSNTGLEGKPNLFSSTIRAFYERTKGERKKLREDPYAVNDDEKIQMGGMTKVETDWIRNNKILHKILKYNRKFPREDKLDAKSSDAHDNSQEGGNDDKTYKNSVSPKYIIEIKNIDVINRGISLKGLRTILEEYRKNEASFEEVKRNNQDICDKIRINGENLTHMLVKPETKHSESYVELFYKVFLEESNNCKTKHEVENLEKDFDETLGAVNVFVSHSWKYSFEELVVSIEQWEKNWEKINSKRLEGKKHETFFYFVDFFAINQHNMKNELQKLHEVVSRSKVTCLVLWPLNEPIPLRRSWCIYEIAKTALSPATRLNVSFSPGEVDCLKEKFRDPDKIRTIRDIITKIDSEKAEATVAKDKKKIDEMIKEELGGFQDVNVLCSRIVRASFVQHACQFADEEYEMFDKSSKEACRKLLDVLKNVGTFLRWEGKFEKSVKYLNLAKKTMEEFYVMDLEEKEDIELPKFERTYSLLKESVITKCENEEERFEVKEKFLRILNSVANSLTFSEQFDEAVILYRKTLEWRTELLTDKAKDTKMTEFNLGVCLLRQGNYKEAEELLSKNLSAWSVDKKYHYWALFNLADLKSKTGRSEEAENDFYEARKGISRICKKSDKNFGRDRFYLLATVLLSKHLLRHADLCGEEKRKVTLNKALKEAVFAWDGFCAISDLAHPDTRLAARTRRRLEIKLHPDMLKKENEERQRFKTCQRTITPELNDPVENKLRVMQWNLLADKLAYPDFKKGAFGCSFDDLDWNMSRKDRIIAEIVKHDPDLIVLIELDHYEDIRFVLQEDFDYESIWKKKTGDFYTDGTGIFWKKDRFKYGKIYKKPLLERIGSTQNADQVFVAVELLPQEGENFAPFVLGGCHLKATKKSIGEEARLDQSKQITNILESEFTDLPVILGADLNAQHVISKNANYKPLAYPYFTKEYGMISAYNNVNGKEPEFTSWKFRIDENNEEVEEWKYTIDFIFHSDCLKSLSVLPMPEEKEIDQAFGITKTVEKLTEVEFARKRCLLPNDRCPSDHLPLVADIQLPVGQ